MDHPESPCPASFGADPRLEVDRLNDEADALLMTSMQQSQDLANRALALAVRAGYGAGEARARMLRGYGHYYLSQYAEALDLFGHSEAQAARLGEMATQARAVNGQIGRAHV